MECKRILIFVVLAVVVGVSTVTSTPLLKAGKESIGRREEFLDNNQLFLVAWEVFTDVKTIYFEVTARTNGFVGFGISPVGGMTGADIVIGGVHPNGTLYFSDRHGVGNREPVVDESQDWILLEGMENSTHTYLKFARLLNTCDPQDVAIGNSTNNFIWSFGQDDFITYHSVNRGTSAVNILDPPMPPVDTSDFQFWRMTHTMEMPSQKTTYWCTVQKSPPLSHKHHIVGFRPVLDTPDALRYTHHFIVHKCKAPAGSSDEETFEKFVGQPGGECYNGSPNVPLRLCESYLFVWAVGGKTVVYPDHVGYPFANDGKANYYLMEVHFDNPNHVQGVTFESGLELFYTPNLRQYDAGTITTGHKTAWTITIPPQAEDYIIVGHCAPSCSSNIPPAGINVFNVLLHSHLAGRKLRLRHFRDGKELPWLASDDNYNFDYQQNRPLLEEVKILPGDQLTYECTYDSKPANGSVIGGLSTTEEMCNSFLWYYPLIELDICSSEFPKATLMEGLGIESMSGGSISDPLVLAPPRLAGKRYTEVLNTMIPWTEANRNLLQQQIRFGNHNVECALDGTKNIIPHATIAYPDISEEYKPVDDCAA